jgi:ArsR family transcriptional regulator, arsenate/arsenite/antimonite-responsive transcriptional repressor
MRPNVDLIGDATRRCMLALLAVEGEVCVCEFVAALGELQPGVSRHLALLREGGWLVSRREGTWMHYRLAQLPHWAKALTGALVDGGVSPDVLNEARRRLKSFAGRPSRASGRAA